MVDKLFTGISKPLKTCHLINAFSFISEDLNISKYIIENGFSEQFLDDLNKEKISGKQSK